LNYYILVKEFHKPKKPEYAYQYNFGYMLSLIPWQTKAIFDKSS